MQKKETNEARIYLRLPKQQKRDIKRVAKARGMTASTLIRTTMMENLK